MGFEKGNKLGKGRPKKVDEQKVNTLFVNALKELYSEDNEESAKIKFIKTTLMDSQRGQLFIAEHIFGKPKDIIDTNHSFDNFSIKDIFSVGKDKD